MAALLTSGGLLIVAAMVAPGPVGDYAVDNPLGIEALDGLRQRREHRGQHRTPRLRARFGGMCRAADTAGRRPPSGSRRPLAWVAATAVIILLVGLALPVLPDRERLRVHGAVRDDRDRHAVRDPERRPPPSPVRPGCRRQEDRGVRDHRGVAPGSGGIIAVLVGFGLVPSSTTHRPCSCSSASPVGCSRSPCTDWPHVSPTGSSTAAARDRRRS